MMPAPALIVPAAAPSLPQAPQIQAAQLASEPVAMEGEGLVARNSAPDPLPAQDADTRSNADRVLPETAGYSGLELIAGLAMSGVGLAAVLAACRKSHA